MHLRPCRIDFSLSNGPSTDAPASGTDTLGTLGSQFPGSPRVLGALANGPVSPALCPEPRRSRAVMRDFLEDTINARHRPRGHSPGDEPLPAPATSAAPSIPVTGTYAPSPRRMTARGAIPCVRGSAAEDSNRCIPLKNSALALKERSPPRLDLSVRPRIDDRPSGDGPRTPKTSLKETSASFSTESLHCSRSCQRDEGPLGVAGPRCA